MKYAYIYTFKSNNRLFCAKCNNYLISEEYLFSKMKAQNRLIEINK